MEVHADDNDTGSTETGTELAVENVQAISPVVLRCQFQHERSGAVNAKQYLSQLRRLRNRIRSVRDDLDMLRAAAQSIGGMNYDKIRVQSTPDPDPLASYMAKIEEKELKLAGLMDEYLDLSLVIREQLAGFLPGNYSDVLFLRYVEGYSLNRIAREMNYSYEHVRHLHGRALQDFQKKYLRQ